MGSNARIYMPRTWPSASALATAGPGLFVVAHTLRKLLISSQLILMSRPFVYLNAPYKLEPFEYFVQRRRYYTTALA
jgi:hypothetical protein